jgi:hypothetical protein
MTNNKNLFFSGMGQHIYYRCQILQDCKSLFYFRRLTPYLKEDFEAAVEKPIPYLKASTIQHSRTIKEAAKDLVEGVD